MADARVALDPILAAFGVPATVTRPAPDDTPIETTGIWITPLTLEVPTGGEFQAAERQYVMALPRADVPTVPRGTIVDAPETLGQADARWRADGVERAEYDHHRVRLVPDPDDGS